MKPAVLVSVALIPLLAGCATRGAAPRGADLSLPGAFESQPSSTLPTAVLDEWWELYQDPQLASLVEQAVARSFDVREAQARLDEARAVREASLARIRWPSGALEGTAETRETEILEGEDFGGGGGGGGPGQPGQGGFGFGGSSQSANLNFNVSYELDVFGRNRAARRVVDADYAAARFAYEATRAALAAQVADALFEARGAALLLEDARQSLRIQSELQRVTAIRAERGLSPGSEVARVEADLRQAEARSAEYESQLRTARRALLVLVGSGSADLETLTIGPAAGLAPEVPQVIPGELLARRPDVREAEARVRSAAGSLSLAELELFPRFTIRPGLGLSTQGGAFEQTSAFWSLGAGLAVPILDRRRLQAEVRASTARAEQAVLGYERAVQTAFSEADQALIGLAADRTRLALLEAGRDRARVAHEAAVRRQELGFGTLQETLDAERTWRLARSAAINARVESLRRSVQVFRALGGGWSPAVGEERTS
jgi:NodT family efflux transporter outer membrane factor (OMF) lipoprotein